MQRCVALRHSSRLLLFFGCPSVVPLLIPAIALWLLCSGCLCHPAGVGQPRGLREELPAAHLRYVISSPKCSTLTADNYSKRCLQMIALLEKYVDPRTIEIPKPSGGMFLFPRLKIESHPDFPAKSPSDIAKGVFDRMIEEKVLAVPGLYFRAPSLSELSAEEEAKKSFFRVSFSFCTSDVMEEGVKRIGRALNKDWRL